MNNTGRGMEIGTKTGKRKRRRQSDGGDREQLVSQNRHHRQVALTLYLERLPSAARPWESSRTLGSLQEGQGDEAFRERKCRRKKKRKKKEQGKGGEKSMQFSVSRN